MNITIINQPPTATADTATVAKNSSANVIDVLANDTDPEGNTLTVTAVSTPTSGTAVVGTGGAYVTYTPNTNFTGSDTFTYTISDGHGNTATGTVSVTVNNTAPLANAQSVPTNENTAVVITLGGIDANGDALTFAIAAAPVNGTLSAITATNCSASIPSNCTASITYTPNTAYSGADSFTFTVNDGTVNSATATVSISVANQPPTANADTATVAKNSTANIIDVLANDTDPEGNTLTVTAVSTPTNGTAAVGTGGANVTYTPNTNFAGTDSFTYTISDGHGNTATGTVAVTVNNTAPVANAQSDSTNANTAFAITLSGTDANGDALTFAIATPPINGTLGAIGTPSCTAGSCTASVTYTPAANYSGAESFTFTVNDGTVNSSAATVSITIINQPPTATADTVTVAKNSSSNVIDVLANDTDPEGNTLTVTAVSTPTSGTAVVGTGGAYVTYTPNTNFTGSGQLHLYHQRRPRQHRYRHCQRHREQHRPPGQRPEHLHQ